MEVKKKRRRQDHEKNIIKVVKAIIKDPTKTQREIAKETGIGLSNVNRKLNEMERIGTKVPSIQEICKQDIEIVRLANQVRKGFVEQVIDKISLKFYFKAKRWEELNKLGLVNNAELSILLEGQDNEYY
jgi:predicted transcriptional regulator